MGGSRAQGLKAAATNKKNNGEDFYAKIALESQKAWIENGRKPRGLGAVSMERRQEISKLALEARRRKRLEKERNSE